MVTEVSRPKESSVSSVTSALPQLICGLLLILKVMVQPTPLKYDWLPFLSFLEFFSFLLATMYAQFPHRKESWWQGMQIPPLILNAVDVIQFCWEGSSNINQITQWPSSGDLGHGQLCAGGWTAKLISQQSDCSNLQSVMIWAWCELAADADEKHFSPYRNISNHKCPQSSKVLNLTAYSSFLSTL